MIFVIAFLSTFFGYVIGSTLYSDWAYRRAYWRNVQQDTIYRWQQSLMSRWPDDRA